MVKILLLIVASDSTELLKCRAGNYHFTGDVVTGNEFSNLLSDPAYAVFVDHVEHLITVDVDTPGTSIDSLIQMSIDTVFLSSYTLQFVKVGKMVSDIHSSYPSIKFVALEDLFVLPRAYIHDTKSLRLFKSLSKRASEFDNFSFISTNEYFNSWGQGDVKVFTLKPTTEIAWGDIVREVEFTQMTNQGNPVPRMVALMVISEQYTDGTAKEYLKIPYYRHPHDNNLPITEMTPTVRRIMESITRNYENLDLNHVLIQLYRDGNDTIAAHSDKTLDIDLDTPIFNFSLGSPRVMTLKNKKNKNVVQQIPLRHMEVVEFGLTTNQTWFHEIKKQADLVPHPEWNTARISFTFRKICTHLYVPKKSISGNRYDIAELTAPDHASAIIVGQGSTFKRFEDYVPGVHTEPDLIGAFSAQNKQSDEFDWNATYGGGFCSL